MKYYKIAECNVANFTHKYHTPSGEYTRYYNVQHNVMVLIKYY